MAPGLGGEQALALIREHGTLVKVLASLDASGGKVQNPFPYEEARRIFKGTQAHRCAMQGRRLCWGERRCSMQ